MLARMTASVEILLANTPSSTLPSFANIEIGRYDFGNDESRRTFGSTTIVATLQVLGK